MRYWPWKVWEQRLSIVKVQVGVLKRRRANVEKRRRSFASADLKAAKPVAGWQLDKPRSRLSSSDFLLLITSHHTPGIFETCASAVSASQPFWTPLPCKQAWSRPRPLGEGERSSGCCCVCFAAAAEVTTNRRPDNDPFFLRTFSVEVTLASVQGLYIFLS